LLPSDTVRPTALVVLVDRDGALLMQHRDELAHVSPNQWDCPVGASKPVKPQSWPRIGSCGA
jgi:hypothetical protein